MQEIPFNNVTYGIFVNKKLMGETRSNKMVIAKDALAKQKDPKTGKIKIRVKALAYDEPVPAVR